MEINILERLPRDLLFYKIFPLLLVQDLLTLPCLNKTWKHLMEDERLWNFLLKEIQKVYYLDLAELKDLSPKKIYLKYCNSFFFI